MEAAYVASVNHTLEDIMYSDSDAHRNGEHTRTHTQDTRKYNSFAHCTLRSCVLGHMQNEENAGKHQ